MFLQMNGRQEPGMLLEQNKLELIRNDLTDTGDWTELREQWIITSQALNTSKGNIW